MKKFLLLLLIVAAGAYVYWPYYTTVKLEDALRAADQEALQRIIDFPAVRQSLKDQVKAKMSAEADGTAPAAADGGATQTQFVSVMLAGAVADKVIDSMVTPESITRFLKLEAAVGSGAAMTLQQTTWHTPTKFSARAADNSRFTFRFNGSDGWRVASVEPGERLGRQASIPR